MSRPRPGLIWDVYLGRQWVGIVNEPTRAEAYMEAHRIWGRRRGSLTIQLCSTARRRLGL